MLEGVPDAISASAYGLGSNRVRESLSQLPVNASAGCRANRGACRPERTDVARRYAASARAPLRGEVLR